MTIIEKEGFILIKPNENNFEAFRKNLEQKHDSIKKNNIVINFKETFSLNKEQISLLLPYSELQRNNNLSFVVVVSSFNPDDYPETFNIAPTLLEAEDIIEMEEIHRDLDIDLELI